MSLCTSADTSASILNFGLSDPTADVSFESKLASENGWTLGYADRVTFEYRRFLIWTQTSGAPMCPSEHVDLAWHLHLTKTRSYATLCSEALKRFLHHEASKEGSAELQRHREMYLATLDAYRLAFNEAPPSDVWPDVDTRFAPSQAIAEKGESTIRWNHDRLTSTCVALVLAAVFGWLLWQFGLGRILRHLSGPEFLLVYVAMVAAAIVGIVTLRGHGPRGQTYALDAFEVAWMTGGPDRVVGTALTSLIDRGLLQLTAQRENDQITGSACNRTAVESTQRTSIRSNVHVTEPRPMATSRSIKSPPP